MARWKLAGDQSRNSS